MRRRTFLDYILSFVLIGTFIFSLTACGSKESGNTGSNVPASSDGNSVVNSADEPAASDNADDLGISSGGTYLAAAAELSTYGYLDTSGNWAIKPQYEVAYPFGRFGLARTAKLDYATMSATIQYIDKDGNAVIEIESAGGIYSFYDFNANGYAVVNRGTSTGIESLIIDLQGNTLFSTTDLALGPAGPNDLFMASRRVDNSVLTDGKIGFVNLNGDFVIEPQFVRVTMYNDQGYAVASTKSVTGSCGIIDEAGEFITSDTAFTWDAVYPHQPQEIDYNTPYITEHDGFYTIDPVSEGLQRVTGWMDGSGEAYGFAKAENVTAVEVEPGEPSAGIYQAVQEFEIAPAYSNAALFHNGLAFVQDPQTKEFGYIDVAGNWVIEPDYHYNQYFSAGGYEMTMDRALLGDCLFDFSDCGLVADFKLVDGMTEFGFKDVNGDWIIEPAFYSVKPFSLAS